MIHSTKVIILQLSLQQLGSLWVINKDDFFQLFINASHVAFPILFVITYFLASLLFLVGYLLYFTDLEGQEGKQLMIRSFVTSIILFAFFSPISTSIYQFLNISQLDKISLASSPGYPKLHVFLSMLIWMINFFLFLAAFTSLIAFFIFLASYLIQSNKRKMNLMLKSFIGILLILYPLSWQFPSIPPFISNL